MTEDDSLELSSFTFSPFIENCYVVNLRVYSQL